MQSGGRGSGGKEGGPSASSFSGRHHPYRRESDKAPVLDEKVENKLYIGNLDHRVTEYHLIKMFSPYGKIRHEEYLWHTHGPRRGEPRGYGFVEYATREEAEKAREKMNSRLAFGRPLVVRFVEEKVTAHNADAPVRKMDLSSTESTGTVDPNSETVSTPITASGATRNAKIAAIQHKLKLMEKGDMSGRKGGGGGGGGREGENGSFGGGNSGRNRGEVKTGGGSSTSQPRTLLQTGQRWSSWG